MAITMMTRLASTARTTDHGPIASTSQASEKTLNSAIEEITKFIPTEVIGIYISGMGIVTPETPIGKWWIFGISGSLILVFIGITAAETRKAGRAISVPRIFGLVACAAVAYVAWASALPGTPFEQISEMANQVGGWAVIIISLIMPRIATVTGIVD